MHIWHFKSNRLQNKSQIRIFFTISLTSVSIVHGALKSNISNYVNRVDVLIPKNMLISIKSFFISLNNKTYRSELRSLWIGEIFGRNCSSIGSNGDSAFHFYPVQFRCCCHCTCKVFAERNLWLGFQDGNNGFSSFSIKP